MEITEVQYARIAPYLPVQRGNVSLSNLQVLNAILYVAEHGQMARLAQSLRQLAHHLHAHEPLVEERRPDRVFEQLQREQIVRIKLEALSLDSTIVKVHPDGTGALKKTDLSRSADPEAAGTTKLHMVAADARTAVTFSLPRTATRCAGGAQAAAPSRSPARRPGATAPTKGTRHANWHSISASHPWFRHSRPGGWVYDREIYKRRRNRTSVPTTEG